MKLLIMLLLGTVVGVNLDRLDSDPVDGVVVEKWMVDGTKLAPVKPRALPNGDLGIEPDLRPRVGMNPPERIRFRELNPVPTIVIVKPEDHERLELVMKQHQCESLVALVIDLSVRVDALESR